MAERDYSVTDLVISEQPKFNSRGGIDMVTRATFNIGEHGPFTLEYPVADYTPQKLADDIATKSAGVKLVDDIVAGC